MKLILCLFYLSLGVICVSGESLHYGDHPTILLVLGTIFSFIAGMFVSDL